MKVFQGPTEIAGQMGCLTKGLSSLGHHVEAFNLERNYLGYHRNIRHLTPELLREIFNLEKQEYDVFHFHYGTSFTSDAEEFRYAKQKNKVRLMHYWGNDVRTQKEAAILNPYARLINHFLDKKLITSRLRMQSQYIPACIVQDFEVASYVTPYFQRIYVLPLAIDLDRIEPHYPLDAVEEPLIIHAPTHPYFKGTDFIEDALDRLRKDGLRFRYRRIEGMSNDEALQAYAEADLVIDQVLCGSHGLLSVEAMALGKPVIAYIREDLKNRFGQELPIVSATPPKLYQAIRSFLETPVLRTERGIAGRKYVERHHALPVVARQLDWIYRREAVILHSQETKRSDPGAVVQLVGDSIHCFPVHPVTHKIAISSTKMEDTYKLKLKPDRFYRGATTYVSFELPKNMVIEQATIRLPLTGKERKIKLKLIEENWNKATIHIRKPNVRKSSLLKVRVDPKRAKRSISVTCTELVQGWAKGQENNHGLLIPSSLRAEPTLKIKVSEMGLRKPDA